MNNLFKRKARHNTYCAFCKSPRRVPRKRNIGVINIIASALTAAVISIVLWEGFDPRGFVVFVIALAFAETFLQLRWRLSIVCRACGFDPALYVKQPHLAAAKVKEHLERRRRDPAALMGKRLNLPTITPERAEQLKALPADGKGRGQLVSRSI
ncbi:MAG: hypothetical protein KF802_15285 [Bdellovibrionaceae bacterium]|nr:hypothetical protein [Pseudobdellovibrionaceae bacterium]MBX3033449.1 hypothetical protein [Pseudobdellovibrionaceae bacterium]